jgi:hypothetical protein
VPPSRGRFTRWPRTGWCGSCLGGGPSEREGSKTRERGFIVTMHGRGTFVNDPYRSADHPLAQFLNGRCLAGTTRCPARAAGLGWARRGKEGARGNLRGTLRLWGGCDARSHVVSDCVEGGRLMPGT